MRKYILTVAMLGTLAGAQLLVVNAESIAVQLGVSQVVIGFTLVAIGTSPPELVTAVQAQRRGEADLLVGKPGGLTTSEALAKGVVPVIVNPIPGQEERNADHLLEEGAALRCNNLPVLGWKIDWLLDDAPRLARLKANVARLARPDAARTIVRALS